MKHLYLPILFGFILFTLTDVNAAAAAPAEDTTQASAASTVPTAPAVEGEPAATPPATPLVGGGWISDAGKTIWDWTAGVAISGWEATKNWAGGVAVDAANAAGKHVHEDGKCSAAAPAPAATSAAGGATPAAAPATL